MAKRKKPVAANSFNSVPPDLFARPHSRRRTGLVLYRFLADEAEKIPYRGPQQDKAFDVLKRWAELDVQGQLIQKETTLESAFWTEVFTEALGYLPATQCPEEYQLEPHFTVPGVGQADAALGNFSVGGVLSPLVVIELKGSSVNLDRDRFNGRTPVQQCWDYLNALPECPWGIVSNFVTFRLYHRAKGSQAYEEFRLQDLKELKRFRQFFCLFERGGLVKAAVGHYLRANHLLEATEKRQREVGDELYVQYSEERARLIEHLQLKLGKGRDAAIHIAQKLLDRIIFVAFCEDRGLLPPQCIDRAYHTIPPFTRVTNPRWRNFLDLFQAVDQGHPQMLGIHTGYDGGLFARDPEVDDLQLDDQWTSFFRAVGRYDFRDEVNVEVLGHLFERSVSELEKFRALGLFELGQGKSKEKPPARPAMQKSAERKRLGTYYTPPDFTRLIVEQTVAAVAAEKLEAVRQAHGLKSDPPEGRGPSPEAAAYWKDCFAALRTIKVCDPACGSGAFLVRAYDVLEKMYARIAERLALDDQAAADELEDSIPDAIVRDNLFGVDVSSQAREITQLALWIRSARRNHTLADLSHNVVLGNSLVTDPAVHAAALDWQATFPEVFSRGDAPGFDCVIGNPPWERMKLQEREFFAFRAPEIAGAVSAATRRKRIAQLESSEPALYAEYLAAQKAAEATLAHVRDSGSFPLTAKGDVNTYTVFAELARKIVAPRGRVGLLVPSGIATDATTREFFASLMKPQALAGLYDFENRRRMFPDVDSRFKFSVLLFGGTERKTAAADFVFFAHSMDDLEERRRHIRLSGKDLALLNPNTRTCPIFRSRRDAELTKAVYRRVPVLIDRTRKQGGNPWGLRFVRMFDQTNDAELFRTAEELAELGAKLDGNRWKKAKQVFLPLYEAKMVQAYDHRAASVVVQAANWVRQGQTEPTTPALHQNPEFAVQPRWWVAENEVERAIGRRIDRGFLGFKDITSPTNQRTMIAAAIPWAAVTNHFPLVLTEASPRLEMCLLANLNALALDYVTRQKIGGVTLNFFIVEQLPVFAPDCYDDRCPWDKRQTLQKWISDRVLRLTCTADDMRPLAEAAGFDPPVTKWSETRRAQWMAELDAAYFLLYQIERDDVQYVLGTFRGREGPDGGLLAGADPVLEAYDRLRGGEP